MSEAPVYPWYQVVRGSDLAQGDLLLGCPRFVIPLDANRAETGLTLTRETVDAIVLTQSCDLAIRPEGDCEATDVLLCAFYLKKDLQEHPVFRKWESWEEVRKGRRPFFHVLDACRLPAHEQDFALVDFHGIFTLSVPLVRDFAQSAGDRLRLLPPYREHLSQSLARTFMRVGLPTDVPPFGKTKSS
jgi:hypothetical protein